MILYETLFIYTLAFTISTLTSLEIKVVHQAGPRARFQVCHLSMFRIVINEVKDGVKALCPRCGTNDAGGISPLNCHGNAL